MKEEKEGKDLKARATDAVQRAIKARGYNENMYYNMFSIASSDARKTEKETEDKHEGVIPLAESARIARMAEKNARVALFPAHVESARTRKETAKALRGLLLDGKDITQIVEKMGLQ